MSLEIGAETLDQYNVKRLYDIKIFRTSEHTGIGAGCFYEVDNSKLLAGAEKIVSNAIKELASQDWVPAVGVDSLEDLIKTVSSELYVILVDKLKTGNEHETRAIITYAAFKYIGLAPILPVLLDPLVDEIYVDSYNQPLYLDHRVYGRCMSNILVPLRTIESLRVFGELFRNVAITFSKPSAKFEFQLNGATLRIDVDYPPLNPYGPSMHIRKHRENPLTLTELFKLGTITPEAAAMLLSALYLRSNVLIIGVSSSGKTTLLNALDVGLPPILRRIYIEDVEETLDLRAYGYRQVKLRTAGLPGDESRKETQVLKVLHKAPDIVVLGEIQTQEHVDALFQALTSGVKGLETFHATSVEQALRRFQEIYEVKRSQLPDLDIIVHMHRVGYSPQRVVAGLYCLSENGGAVSIYTRDAASNKLLPRNDIAQCYFMRRLAELYDKNVIEKTYKAFYYSLIKTLDAKAAELGQFISVYTKALNEALSPASSIAQG